MRRFCFLLIILAVARPATACLWDYDTLQMERLRFPGALELIVGKFLRHSQPFYEWRVRDREAKIAAHDSGQTPLSDEDLSRAFDDLAVALDRLGRHDDAIARIREKADRLPDVGQYEMHANLGTFLVHAGKLEEGLAELNKAIELNPGAHFGREKYQVRLVEYLKENRDAEGNVTLPLAGSFATWLLEKEGLDDGSEEALRAQLDKAVEGVLGMMRFGDYRSPVLLEALGDLLATSTSHQATNESQRLAARAYLRAASAVKEEQVIAAYRELAENAIGNQLPDRKSGEEPDAKGQNLSLASLEEQLAREVHEAEDWFAQTIAHDEELWVIASPDPDRRFWEKYGDQEIRVGHDRLPAGKFAMKGLPWPIRAALLIGLVLTVLGVAGALVWRRRRPTGYSPGEQGRNLS